MHMPSVQVRAKLTVNGAPNVMPFRWFKESPHAAYLVRQYFHANLLERLSSPPFLSLIEKKWLAFQLLQAVQQCHAVGVCHGDIKAENVPPASTPHLLPPLTCCHPSPTARLPMNSASPQPHPHP
jgi:phosphoinositide-3-kinase regulatory subunit 4